MFQRVFQLLASQLQRHQSVFIFVKTGDVAHGNLAFGNARLWVEAGGHRNIGMPGFELHALNQIDDRSVFEPRVGRG